MANSIEPTINTVIGANPPTSARFRHAMRACLAVAALRAVFAASLDRSASNAGTTEKTVVEYNKDDR